MTTQQRLDAAIKIAQSAFKGRQSEGDLYALLELISLLGKSDEFLRLNADNYREALPDFMTE